MEVIWWFILTIYPTNKNNLSFCERFRFLMPSLVCQFLISPIILPLTTAKPNIVKPRTVPSQTELKPFIVIASEQIPSNPTLRTILRRSRFNVGALPIHYLDMDRNFADPLCRNLRFVQASGPLRTAGQRLKPGQFFHRAVLTLPVSSASTKGVIWRSRAAKKAATCRRISD